MTSVATTRKDTTPLRVVILGGGYTGVWAYRALTRWLGRRVTITVVSDYDFHSFHGYVGDVLAGHVNAKHLRSPLSRVMRHAHHILGTATHIDSTAHEVLVTTATGELQVPYDQLIVATGAEEHTAPVPGLEEHGWRMRQPGVPHKLVQHVSELLLAPGHSDSPRVLDEHTHDVVVVGAGFTGAEMASALAYRLGTRGRVILVYSSELPIPVWANRPRLQRSIAASLKAAGVQLRSSTRVRAVSASGVELADGSHLPAKIVIAAVGNRATMPTGLEAYTTHRGLLLVSPFLRVREGIWAGGDVAEVRNRRGVPVPQDALWALAAGTRIGRNIAREHLGHEPKRFGFIGLGAAATFAPWVTSAELYGIPLPNRLAYTLRSILWLWFMPSRLNALRILTDAIRHRRTH